MTQPLSALDYAANDFPPLPELIAAEAHPGRGTGGWFKGGWLALRQDRRWAALEAHQAAAVRNQANEIGALGDDLHDACDEINRGFYNEPLTSTVDLAYLATLLEEV